VEIRGEELLRAARILAVRSRRESTGLFSGNYASAFRGGGLEFEESRPYVPGDDVRTIDWNATARQDELFVKRHREERDQTLLFALDVSASMRFGSGGCTKATTAAHALALMAAAAGRVGDGVGLVAFDSGIRAEVPIARGPSHSWRVIRTAVESAGTSRGVTSLAVALHRADTHARSRSVVIAISDFRDAGLLPEEDTPSSLSGELSRLSRRHDLVAAVVVDPREEELPAAGRFRVVDPERRGATFTVASSSRRLRERYRAAAAARRRRLELELRQCGVEALWLRTDRNPLHALGRFFRERAARRSKVSA
jgi:uncharacterized protein (DUF58 family)